MSKFIKAAIAGLTAAACLASSEPSVAHEVQPMITTVTPSGSGANFRLMIRNTDAMPITLEVSPYRVAVDDAGVATRTAEDADVILFPPQTIVQPGAEQAIQVRYVGEPGVTEGRLYAIVVSQLPVDFTKVNNSDTSQTQVKIGFDFVSHMVVQPASARAALTISPVTRQANGDLWRHNCLVRVIDKVLGFDQEMLISKVTYSLSERGSITTLQGLHLPALADLV